MYGFILYGTRRTGEAPNAWSKQQVPADLGSPQGIGPESILKGFMDSPGLKLKR